MISPRSAVPIWRFDEAPEQVAEALDRGAVVAIPTESSYGLAVDPRNAAGVAAIYRLKLREAGKPLLAVGAEASAFTSLGVSPDDPGLCWAARFWPAALSVVVAIEEPIPASAGGRSLAVRVPDHAELRALLAALGRPLTATSANRSGSEGLLDPAVVARWLESAGVEGLVVDGGVLAGGPPSTLVAWRGQAPVVLRAGRFRVA